MAKIPKDIKAQVEEIVNRFNQKVIQDPNYFFVLRFRGSFVYLDRKEGRIVSKCGRLEYGENMKNWAFAIFKYSSESYDPDEWMFPGSEHLNGTVEGGLKACLEAYP